MTPELARDLRDAGLWEAIMLDSAKVATEQRKALIAERERCAMIADSLTDAARADAKFLGRDIADAIRAEPKDSWFIRRLRELVSELTGPTDMRTTQTIEVAMLVAQAADIIEKLQIKCDSLLDAKA